MRIEYGRVVDYMKRQGCHLPDGSGMANRGAVVAGTHGRLLTVDGGREFLVRVPGAAMSDLDDARLAAVLNWMLTQFDPEDSHDFAPTKLTRSRTSSAPLIDVKSTRAACCARSRRRAPT